jgi:HSP20 family protein
MRALTPWRPRGGLSLFHDDFDSLFSRFFGEDEERPGGRAFLPAVESFVRDGNLVIRVDLPGIKPEDVDLSVEGDRLTIKAERKAEQERSDEGGRYREVSYGTFQRTVVLPQRTDTESISATFKNGVLDVTLKAPSELVTKKVPISVH